MVSIEHFVTLNAENGQELIDVFPATGISQFQDQLDKVVLHYTIQTELAWKVRFQLTLQLIIAPLKL